MTSIFGSLVRLDPPVRLIVAVAVLVVGLSVGLFLIGAEGTTPDPVPFEKTVETGMASEHEQLLRDANATIPRAEVFHSQYQFVVGYYGVGYMIDELQQPGYVQQFGRPIAIYVTDYAGTAPTVTDAGYPQTETDAGWVRAQEAVFVVDSAAQTPGGDAILPFSSKSAATDFTQKHGGDILDWQEVRTEETGVDHAELVREQVETYDESADDRVTDAQLLLDRNESVVVGDDASTIQAAINTAPSGSAVRVPPGTYDEKLRVNRSVTITGPGATISGDGNGSVITVTSDDVAIEGLTIEGVGDSTEAEEGEVDDDRWDAFVEAGYGHSDAAIEAESVSNLSVTGVDIETPTTGVLLRDVDGAVVRQTDVSGHRDQWEGFMGVLSIRSPVVVQNSTFADGRDGIYLHLADGSVIRDNRFVSNRYGVHLMYTSDSLIADNVARQETLGGITTMTEPSGNAVVGNDVRNSTSGMDLSGGHSYIAENTLANNERGLLIGTDQSLYERNVLYGNEVGLRTGSIRPSNRVVRNDFVANEQTVTVGSGPLRIWGGDGEGNYWSKRPAGIADGSYSPTAPLDSSLQEPGVRTLASAPAATMLALVRETVAGSREGEVLDTAPRSRPVRPQTIDELERRDND